MSLVFALLASASVFAGCKGKPSKSDCEKLRAHLVDLEAAASGGGEVSSDQKPELDAQKAKVNAAVPLDFCMDDMSPEQVQCGIKARTLEDLDKVCNKT